MKTGLDPRVKLIIVLSLSTPAVLIKDIYFLAGILLTSIILVLLFKSPIFSIVKRVKKILTVMIFLVLIQSIFTVDGTNIFHVAGITFLTVEGLMKGLQLVLRILIIITSASIMATNNPREIVQGLVQWKVPYEIAFMVSIAIRFLPMLTEEIKDVVTAIQLRGIELEKIPLGKRIKVYSYVIMPIVASTLIKARKLSTAMEMRGFGAYENRTSYHILEMQKKDYVITIITLLSLMGLLVQYYL